MRENKFVGAAWQKSVCTNKKASHKTGLSEYGWGSWI